MLSGKAFDFHCHSNLTRAILPFRLAESDVHDVLNVFQVTGLNKDGQYYMYVAIAAVVKTSLTMIGNLVPQRRATTLSSLPRLIFSAPFRLAPEVICLHGDGVKTRTPTTCSNVVAHLQSKYSSLQISVCWKAGSHLNLYRMRASMGSKCLHSKPEIAKIIFEHFYINHFRTYSVRHSYLRVTTHRTFLDFCHPIFETMLGWMLHEKERRPGRN